MLSVPPSLLAYCLVLGLAWAPSSALSANAGSFVNGGNTLVSAMMMLVGNEEKVFILDKAEGNAAVVDSHPAWGSVWDMNTHQSEVMDVRSNVFCSSGMHLPNGSWIALGGNSAVGRGGNTPKNVDGSSANWDPLYQDFDGGRAIRVLNPCTSQDIMSSPECQWFDDDTVLAMKKRRWYSAAEALADGSVVIVGGFVNGGYINRNYPNNEPCGGGAECTYEFYPPRPEEPRFLPFLERTSGLNAYAHTFLMPSGLMFVQANISTMLWNYNTNEEIPLPSMPHNVVRVYPASGAVAMLPLTPANNYLPTIIFCGGSDMPDEAWGSYAFPAINTWLYPASKDCQRITPEPTDGSPVHYEQDDDMPEGRTMSQFIILPDGKLLVVNGGLNGTAGYSEATGQTDSAALMPNGMSLASGPVLTPAIYDPEAPAGKRWSNAGLEQAIFPRLYHSSAMLLPDSSVLIAGSNPNVDVNLTTTFKTTYDAEIFYPPYFSASTKPVPIGVPKTLSYGGNAFDITIRASSYSGNANDAAQNTKVTILRGGFTTHAMNMGQRYLQLNNTFTVNNDGTIILHVAQPPPNPFILQPGPAFLFVVVDGIPSNGTFVIVGSGNIEEQPTHPNSVLPPSVLAAGNVSGSGAGNNGNNGNGGNSNDSSGGMSLGAIIGGSVAGVVALGAVIALAIVLIRRKKGGATGATKGGYAATRDAGNGMEYPMGSTNSSFSPAHMAVASGSSSFIPLNQDNSSTAWNASSLNVADPAAPYRDYPGGAPAGPGALYNVQREGGGPGHNYSESGFSGYDAHEPSQYDPYASARPPPGAGNAGSGPGEYRY